ncbi:MAG: tRNA (adenosine(37)-N6)-dimethylallyltransferase MiaA [Spirochaetaceae bacterium]|nr:tRNA (adenosine(37)-N6)-dimethylallyltransferase MiaA [Spirochaetaceae bacterium]
MSEPGSRAGAQAGPRPRVTLLLGPTAVGKSRLLEDLLPRLRQWRVEVINADSRQVYRGLDAGTAKPPQRLRRRLPHHLVDVVDPDRQFTAGDFVRAADRLVGEIERRGGRAVVAGGAAFYLWSFLHGLPAAPPGDASIRRELRERLRTEGAAALHAELARKDPDGAARLPPADVNRVLRALEVFQLTGTPWSSFRPAETVRRDFELLILGLQRDRADLYRRIDRRVEEMFAGGLAAEVAALCARGYHRDTPAMRSIGYAEFFPAHSAPDEATMRLIQRNTRRLAKRQLTFFRRFPDVRWLPADSSAEVGAAMERFLASPDTGTSG